MREENKTKHQLINEIHELHRRIANLESSEVEHRRVEEKLKETEKIFSLFMKYSPIYIFFKDDKIRSLQLSNNFEQMLGRPMHEMIGKTMDDLFPSEFATSMIADDMRTLKEGKPLEVEEEFDGRIYSTLKFPIIQDDAPKYLAGFAIDITDQKKIEQALMESERKYSTIIEKSNDGIVILQDGVLKFVNPKMVEMSRFPIKDLLGKPFIEFIAPDFKKLVMQRYQKRISGESVPDRYEIAIITREGKPIPVEINPSLIEYEGRPADMAIIRDITERREAEEGLLRSENILKQTQQISKTGGWEYDVSKQQLHWTDEVYRIHDVPPDYDPNNISENMEFYAPDDQKVINRAFWDAVEKGTPYDLELQFKSATGTHKWVRTTAQAERQAGKTIRVFGNIIDITGQKKLEQETIKTHNLESVGTLAGGLAHDFNNLLQTILGNISLARMYLVTHPPEKIASLLKQAEETLETAKQLSFRLLTFSKGGEPLLRESSVEDILRKSIDISLSGSRIHCDLALPHDLWPIEVDEGQMTQVFNNILINAKEAMPDGGTISISAGNVVISQGGPLPLEEGEYVQISIKDQGIGMPEEILSRIFDPYFTTKEMGSQKGLGLGLSICLSIVTKHEGHISVDSVEGSETTFHVFLPSSKKSARDQEITRVQPQDISRRRLLFMDDDTNIRHLVREMMGYLGYEAEFARNGEEAIELYRRSKESGEAFDIVILDLTVQGGMGGEKTIKKLIEIDPDVNAVISSGYVDAPVIRDYKQYGFVDAIIKPYRMEQLKEILDKKFRSAGNH